MPYCPISLSPYDPIALLPYCQICLYPYCPIAVLPFCRVALFHYCPCAALLQTPPSGKPRPPPASTGPSCWPTLTSTSLLLAPPATTATSGWPALSSTSLYRPSSGPTSTSTSLYCPLLLASCDHHQRLQTLPAGQPCPPRASTDPSYWPAYISTSLYSPFC